MIKIDASCSKSRTIRTSLLTILIFSFYFLSFQQAFGQSILNQSITIDFKKISVSEALLELSEVANISIAFNSSFFKDDQKVNLSAQNRSLKYCLDQCLQHTGITYNTKGNRIILIKKQAENFIISGYIEDEESGERLISATVWDTHSGIGITTNEYGFFSLRLSRGLLDLRFSYIGYQQEQKKLDLQKNTRLQINLKPSLTLIEVIVTNKDTSDKNQRLLLGEGAVVLMDDIRQSPALGGEPDVMRYLQTQSGVNSGTDGLGGLFVRGGNADQNLILLDGVPVFNPSHTLGLFSVFNTSMIRKVHFMKDGFSAKYGGRLSSVVGIRSKEGNTKNLVGEIETTTLATKLMLEVPLSEDKSALLISARRSHIDPWIKNYSKRKKTLEENTGETSYLFYDLNLKFHTTISKNDRLFWSFYTGKDDYEDRTNWEYAYQDDFEDFFSSNQQRQALEWGNTISSLRWNHIFGEKLFSNTTLTYSQYDYHSENEWQYIESIDGDTLSDRYFTDFRSIIQDVGLKIDFDYYLNNNHKLVFGAGGLFRDFKPGAVKIIDNFEEDNLADNFEDWFNSSSFKANEFNFYIEDQYRFAKQFRLLIGLHNASFSSSEKTYFSIQPRLSLEWKAPKSFSAYMSFSRMTQFLHVLTSSGAGLPTDLWVPSTKLIKPEQSWQTSITFLANNQKGYAAKASIYYKNLEGLLHYLEEVNLPDLFENDPLFWEEEVTTGKGYSYGFETQFQKTKGSTHAELSYTYSHAERTFEELNAGNSFPFAFDRPHDIKINLSQKLSKKATLQIGWQYNSGQAITLIATDQALAPLDNFGNTYSEQISDINGYRLRAYHRLDINLSLEFGNKNVHHFLNLGIYNTYNRFNSFYEYLYEDEFFPEDNGFIEQYGLPVLPSIGYRVRFVGK